MSTQYTLEAVEKAVWHPFSQLRKIKEQLAVEGGRLIFDNWSAKYINIRIDIRTGAFTIQEGNTDDNPQWLTFRKVKE